MAHRFRALCVPGRIAIVLGVVAALVGCLVGGRHYLSRAPVGLGPAGDSQPTETFPPGWYSIEITDAHWSSEWFSPPATSTFVSTVKVTTQRGFMFVVMGNLKITDGQGNTLRSWMAIKRLKCSKHREDSDRLNDHEGTAVFEWEWNGTPHGSSQVVADGPYRWEFTARFRAKTDRDSGTVWVDRTAPSITIEQPQGEVTGDSVPVSIRWADSSAGIHVSTAVVEVDGSPVSGLAIGESGASGTVDDVTEGGHSLTASVEDRAGNEASASSSFDVILDGPPEQKTCIVGTVADSNGRELSGVEVTSPGSSSPATTDADGWFLIEMTSAGGHWLTFDKDGYIPVQRWAEVTESQHYNIGEVRMVAEDPLVTTIGPEGGTVRDSSGDVELEIPPGALSQSVEIRMTHIPSDKELPGPLNASENLQYPIDYMLCVAIEPAGLSFGVPATLRYPNKWGFRAGESVPTAIWDMASNRWVPDGGHMTVSADASKFEKTLSSLAVARSSQARASGTRTASRLYFLDCNASTWGPTDPGSTDRDPDDKECTPSNSSLTISDSGYRKSVSLPAVSAPGGRQTLSFSYKSDTACPSAFINHLQYFGVDDMGSIHNWSYEVEVNGARKEVTFSPPAAPSRLLFFWDGRNAVDSLSPTGLYTSTAISTVRFESPYYTSQATWGGAPTGMTSGLSPRPAEKRRIVKEPIALVNEVDSPCGAGWSLSGIRRLHPQPDGRILEVDGGDAGTVYYPYNNFARLTEGASITGVVQGNHVGDPRNMLGYHGATRTGSEDIDYSDGFAFDYNEFQDWDWVVVDLGQVRQIHTIGLSFHPIETGRNPVLGGPVIKIYVSPDGADWTLWSQISEDVIDGMTAAKLTSPYLVGNGADQPVRFVKYMMYAPYIVSPIRNYVNEVYRLYAFGSSDRYGTGENGQDEDYPKLNKLEPGGWKQTERDGTRYVYDSKGLLQSVADIYGVATTYTWTADGLLTEITDAAGGVTRLDYANGKLREVTDVAGRRTSFTVDSNGDLTQVIMPDGSTTRLSYDGRHLIQSQTDARGQQTTYTWDPVYPNLKKTSGPGGREIITEAGYFNHLINGITGTDESPAPSPGFDMQSTRTDELGRTTTYKWEARGPAPDFAPLYRSTTTDFAGRSTQRYMHPRIRGLEVLRIEPDGSRMRNTYDAEEGRLVLKVEDLSEAEGFRVKAQYTYEPAFDKVATSTDLGGHTRSYSYSEKGDLISTLDPLGNATNMGYDEKGRLAWIRDAEGAITRFEYDERGNRTKIMDALGRITTMTYDAAGNMTSLTDPGGKVTRWEYDLAGRVTGVTDPAGGGTVYEYEPGGGCASGCGSGGGRGLLTSITDPAGNKTTFEYDAAGRLTAVVNPLGGRREYVYDQAGRLVKSRNARGQEITYQYDASNNLVRKTLPDEGDVEYVYDSLNRLTQMSDADSILRYEYAAFTGAGPYWSEVGSQLKGSKIMESFGLKDDPRYSKQASGVAKYGQQTDFQDQSGNWQTRIELPAKILMLVDADAAPGGVVGMDSQAEYDSAHRILRSGSTCPNASFTYDKVGRRKTMEVRASFMCDPCPLGCRAMGATPSPSRSAARSMLWCTGNEWNKTAYEYDAAGLLQSIAQTYKSDDGTIVPLATYSYGYDLAGNRTSMTDMSGTHSYGYDARYQLTSATHPTEPTESFSYDATGNRTASHISPFYTYNRANQLLEDAEFTYSYDLDGNCIGKVSKLNGERHEYIFNSENRMTGYRKHDMNNVLLTSASYFYDPLGRRIAKEVDGLLTRYVYQNEDIWMVIDPYDAFTRIIHGPGIDEPLIQVAGGQDTPPRTEAELTYYFADGLGTIRNTVTKRCFLPTQLTAYAYDSFGRPTASTTLPTAAPAYAFTGREWDAENGTYYFRARQFLPGLGRFSSPDPVQPLARDVYVYVRNDPLAYTDPMGLWVVTDLTDPSRNTIVCDGNGRIAIQLGDARYGDAPDECEGLIKTCMTVHEGVHKYHAWFENPRLCAGKSPGLVIDASTGAQQRSTEQIAHSAEIRCLDEMMANRKRKPVCDKCYGWLMMRKHFVETDLSNYR
ncbi:MAG: RHS repeat-associated core domain-containing protein [Acidobacteriota bacterium]